MRELRLFRSWIRTGSTHRWRCKDVLQNVHGRGACMSVAGVLAEGEGGKGGAFKAVLLVQLRLSTPVMFRQTEASAVILELDWLEQRWADANVGYCCFSSALTLQR